MKKEWAIAIKNDHTMVIRSLRNNKKRVFKMKFLFYYLRNRHWLERGNFESLAPKQQANESVHLK